MKYETQGRIHMSSGIGNWSDICQMEDDNFVGTEQRDKKAQGFKKKFKVIFSSENPKCLEKGSFEGVTGAFGLMMASVTIQKLMNKYQK